MKLQGKDLDKIFKKVQAKPSRMPRLRMLTDEQLKQVKLIDCHFYIIFVATR